MQAEGQILNPPTEDEIRQFIEYLNGGERRGMAADYDDCDEEGAAQGEELDLLPENGVQKRNRTASMYFYRHHYLSIIQEEEESAEQQQAATPASSREAMCRLYSLIFHSTVVFKKVWDGNNIRNCKNVAFFTNSN